MSKPTLAIISSVPEVWFSFIGRSDSRFAPEEIASAHKNEKQVFVDAIGIPDLEKKVNIEVIRAMDGIPRDFSADAYILGWSPSMVTEASEKEWIARLISFVRAEVESGKPLLGICFGHQVLATAFWWEVGVMQERRIGPGEIVTNTWETIQSLWSHKQAVYSPGEAQIITQEDSWDGIIQMIQIGEHAHGVQFHPEFTPEFTTFLVKLMRETIEAEWMNPDTAIDKIAAKGPNPSSVLLREFIKKYYNI